MDRFAALSLLPRVGRAAAEEAANTEPHRKPYR